MTPEEKRRTLEVMDGMGIKAEEKPRTKEAAKPRLAAAGGQRVDEGPAAGTETISVEDFHADMKTHQYIYAPAREMWPAVSVDARLEPIGGLSASKWIAKYRPVEQLTWWPGYPQIIKDKLINEGGWIDHQGASVFNLYLGPKIAAGNSAQAGRWIEHIRRIYPNDADHIIKWLAQRRQRPEEKINHALVLGGKQGIGKDTILEPIKQAVGPWNFVEVSPKQMLGRFNGFVKSTILRVSEARDLGDVDRFAFYDHMKVYTAAPPDVLRVDEKHMREYGVTNCCGVIITTNHKTDGIYLPADDRRHYVAWSDLSREEFSADYWAGLYGFYASGGNAHVAAYLDALDIKNFDPKAPPEKTEAFWSIVDASRSPENSELDDLLDEMGRPNVVPLSRLIARADGGLGEWIKDRKNRRAVPHRLEECGYVPVRNDTAKDGLWKISGRREVVYGRAELTLAQRLLAARSQGAST